MLYCTVHVISSSYKLWFKFNVYDSCYHFLPEKRKRLPWDLKRHTGTQFREGEARWCGSWYFSCMWMVLWQMATWILCALTLCLAVVLGARLLSKECMCRAAKRNINIVYEFWDISLAMTTMQVAVLLRSQNTWWIFHCKDPCLLYNEDEETKKKLDQHQKIRKQRSPLKMSRNMKYHSLSVYVLRDEDYFFSI